MKKFKKISAGLLSLALLACIGTSQAFAADIIETEGGQATKDATVHVFTPADETIRVVIDWGALTYDVSQSYDAETKKYSYGINSTDSGTDNKITITNESNIKIQADLAFKPKDGYEGKLEPSFSGSETFQIDAVSTDGSDPYSEETFLTINPVEDADLSGLADDEAIGAVTVTVNKAST